MPVTNLRQFKLDLSRMHQHEIPAKVLQVQRAIGLHVISQVIQRSPVDTGRFRMGWQAKVGNPSLWMPPEGAESYAVPNASTLLASSGLTTPFQALYITNNLPYAERLEEGWSKQAPEGIVAQTVASINQFIAMGGKNR